MNIEKLIESVRLCGSTPKVDQCKQCAYWSGGDMSKCIPRMTTTAVTALSTFQAENEKLRAEVESLKKGYCAGCSIPAVKAEQIRDLTDAPKLRAELEQVTLENNALWTYIEIVDREYRRYMDSGYIDRLDELRRTWRRGQKED